MYSVRMALSWALALGLVFVFLQATIHPLPNPPEGSVKLFDPPGQNIVFATLADRSGVGLFEPAGRVVVAFIELFAALLLLLPWSRRFGAVIAFTVLAGAVGLHLSPWLGREVPTALSLDPAIPSDGGALFMLAVAMLVVSVLLVMIHPGRRAKKAK